MVDRSPVANGIAWLVSRRGFLIVAWVATLIALIYGEESWRGRRAWNKYRQQLETTGAVLDYRAYWPKPVPDDQNFAAIPVIEEWFAHPTGTESDSRWQDNFAAVAMRVESYRARLSEPAHRQFMDLVAWEAAFKSLGAGNQVRTQEFHSTQYDLGARAKAAPTVLEGLATNEAVFAELREASRRPFARYPIQYDVGLPGGLAEPPDFRSAYARLELRACAELAAGQAEKALADVKLILYLNDTFKEVPLLFTQWSRAYRIRMAVQPIWEGLAEHAWLPAQLQELATLLLRQDFLTACQFGLDAERASALWTIDCLPKSAQLGWLIAPASQNLTASTLTQLTHWPDWLGRIMPHGWLDREKVAYCQLMQTYLRSGFDPAGKRVSPPKLQSNAAEADRLYPQADQAAGLRLVLSHRIATARLSQRELDHLIRGFCYCQALADQAAIACALEQYRLAKGQFPETLELLAPSFMAQLPKDALTGQAYRYRRLDDGRFVLYSVGWNEQDEGGTVVSRKDGSVDLGKGDWTWQP